MKPSIKLDATDKKILEILQANSNITNAQLAKGDRIITSANLRARQ
jgi:DNA-binding Lrp family transcriptional regulator